MKWDSESRIKSIIYADNYIPQQQYFKIPKYKNSSYYKSEPRSITQGEDKIENGDKPSKANAGKSMRWYPGSKIETFNVYYKPLRDLRGDQDYYDSKLKWNSEPSFNKGNANYQINENNSKTPVNLTFLKSIIF